MSQKKIAFSLLKICACGGDNEKSTFFYFLWSAGHDMGVVASSHTRSAHCLSTVKRRREGRDERWAFLGFTFPRK